MEVFGPDFWALSQNDLTNTLIAMFVHKWNEEKKHSILRFSKEKKERFDDEICSINDSK